MDLDFEIFQNPEEKVFFPKAQRVFAKTLASDLVPVRPLSAPTGNWHIDPVSIYKRTQKIASKII